jgi:hypothetical protein
MTLDKLIATLTRLRDQEGGDLPVLAPGHEEGYDDVGEVDFMHVVDLREPGEKWDRWWSGHYENAAEYYDGVKRVAQPAVVIR